MKTQLKLLAPLLVLAAACESQIEQTEFPDPAPKSDINVEQVARILSSLPLQDDNLREVYDAVSSSSGNGYDEEYTMQDLFLRPGTGVGGGTKAGNTYSRPIRDLISDYLATATKASSITPEDYISILTASDIQLYWPYSEDWNGSEYPIITFDPGFGAESNYGFCLARGKDGELQIDSVFVDESVALKHPVWVVNRNDDSAFTPLELFLKSNPGRTEQLPAPSTKSASRTLLLHSFKMLRNYDSWFGGASEFKIQMGSVNGFRASTEAELKLYYPSITEFIVVVKRKELGQELNYDAVVLTDFTNQLDKIAFLVTEDDGGTRTSWKCDATVKVQSKAYGFTIELPFNEKDDIVWRGQLAASFFKEEDTVSARFGDVVISFELE